MLGSAKNLHEKDIELVEQRDEESVELNLQTKVETVTYLNSEKLETEE